MVITKVYLNYNNYKIYGDILLFHYQNALFQYIIKNNNFSFVTKMPFQGIVNSINFLKNDTLLIDNKKSTFMFTYRANNDNF